MRRILLLIGSMSLFVFVQADAIDDAMKKMMETDHVPGSCVAMIGPDNKVEYRSYGFSNLELSSPFTPKSVFRIASLSKQFCAYTVLSLVKDGKIGLDDSIRKYMPDANPSWASVKIRHMLSHTSGIADPGSAFSYSKPYTLKEYLDLLGSKPLAEEPGTKYRYNNFAYGLLGQLAGVVAKKEFSEVVKERVFDKVGMASTAYYDPTVITPNRADAYRWRDGKLVRPIEDRPKVFEGSGGILSTMEDMVKCELALRFASRSTSSNAALDQSILKQQWTCQILGQVTGYGFGWHVAKDEVRHTGETFGFTSAFLRSLADGWTILVFKNCDGGESMEWARKVLELRKAQAQLTQSSSNSLTLALAR